MSGNARARNTLRSSRTSTAERILTHAQAGRAVIQDFVPLAESLEWQLGQEYFRRRGTGAFLNTSQSVPFLINNDGLLSERAAEVFFASLVEAEQQAPLPANLFVLELGVGLGLFARYFLDAFRDLCAARGKDYYDRLTYILGDYSERMLHDVCRRGVLAGHPGRYRIRLVNALQPEQYLPHDLMFREAGPRPVWAVFLNYVLDCLPAAALEFVDEQVKQLCVRICLARDVRLADHTELTLAQLVQRAASTDPRHRDDLLEVYGLFASEYDYRPVDPARLPYGDFAVQYGRKHTRRLLHNYGAIQAIERLLDMTDERGFLLINDYGSTQTAWDDEVSHQRFSLTTAIGLNFPLLKAFFGEGGRCQFLAPSGDHERPIHTRLLGKQFGSDTRLRFEEQFAKSSLDQAAEPQARAAALYRAGRVELAATCYQDALRRQPRNWALLHEVSIFATFGLRDPKAGVDLAKLALALNPACSSDLWNALGDGLFEWGRHAEARSAYERAIHINQSDVRAWTNLAWVHQAMGDYEAALRALAEGLALDRTGEFREQLVQKQAEVLSHLGRRHQRAHLRVVNLVSRSATTEQDRDSPTPDPTPPDRRTR